MRGHTGGVMSFRWGVVHEKASKQKLNTKSSTKSEVVGVSEYVPHKVQMINFLTAQGHTLQKRVLYQDNQSAMLLEKNGRGSSSKRTRHINIRYFFVADRIANGEVKVEYCPTGDMLADFFTKPLQGSTFRKFRNEIMNITGDPSNTTIQDHRSVLDKVSTASTTNTTKNNTTGNIPRASVDDRHKGRNMENDEHVSRNMKNIIQDEVRGRAAISSY
jgi:hypothetical protein